MGWQTSHCSHSSPPASLTVPHRREDSTGGEEWHGLSPPPPAQPSRVPASPPEVFPNACSHGRHVGTRSSQAAVREAAFPRSPASALPTPPVPPPRCGCKGDRGPTAQSPVTSTSHSPMLPGSPAPPLPAYRRCWFRGAQSRAFCFFFFIHFPHYLKCIQMKPFLKRLPHSQQAHSSLWLCPPKASLGHRQPWSLSDTVAPPQLSPAKQCGFFPSALEAACSTFEHLVATNL